MTYISYYLCYFSQLMELSRNIVYSEYIYLIRKLKIQMVQSDLNRFEIGSIIGIGNNVVKVRS